MEIHVASVYQFVFCDTIKYYAISKAKVVKYSNYDIKFPLFSILH